MKPTIEIVAAYELLPWLRENKPIIAAEIALMGLTSLKVTYDGQRTKIDLRGISLTAECDRDIHEGPCLILDGTWREAIQRPFAPKEVPDCRCADAGGEVWKMNIGSAMACDHVIPYQVTIKEDLVPAGPEYTFTDLRHLKPVDPYQPDFAIKAGQVYYIRGETLRTWVPQIPAAWHDRLIPLRVVCVEAFTVRMLAEEPEGIAIVEKDLDELRIWRPFVKCQTPITQMTRDGLYAAIAVHRRWFRQEPTCLRLNRTDELTLRRHVDNWGTDAERPHSFLGLVISYDEHETGVA